MEVTTAHRSAADVLARATIVLIVTGRELGEDVSALLCLSDLTALNVPELSAKKAWNPALLFEDPTLFYGLVQCAYSPYVG